MECRICLEDNDQYTMVRPCACRGTAEWIHRECLLRYLEVYPTGVCHVCKQSMFHQEPSVSEYWSIVPFLFALYASNAGMAVKVTLFLGVLNLAYVLRKSHVWFSIGAAIVLFLYGAFSPSIVMNITIVLLLAMYTATVYVPTIYLCTLGVVSLLAAYGLMLTYVVYQYLDGWANGIFNIALVFFWILWIRRRPAVHLE
jgi:E3 ubiquitin-protein ligase DOA10